MESVRNNEIWLKYYDVALIWLACLSQSKAGVKLGCDRCCLCHWRADACKEADLSPYHYVICYFISECLCCCCCCCCVNGGDNGFLCEAARGKRFHGVWSVRTLDTLFIKTSPVCWWSRGGNTNETAGLKCAMKTLIQNLREDKNNPNFI